MTTSYLHGPDIGEATRFDSAMRLAYDYWHLHLHFQAKAEERAKRIARARNRKKWRKRHGYSYEVPILERKSWAERWCRKHLGATRVMSLSSPSGATKENRARWAERRRQGVDGHSVARLSTLSTRKRWRIRVKGVAR